MVDGAEGVRRVGARMKGLKNPFPVAIDVDVSVRLFGGKLHIGVKRSPVRTVADVVALAGEIAKQPGLRLGGVMGYEAQVAGLGDRNPFKKMMNPIYGLVRRHSVRKVSALRREIAEALVAKGMRPGIFNGGGTGSLTYAIHEPWLTELTAGSGFVCSHLFDYFSNFRLEPAAFFALQASRASDPGMVTCLGGGYVASGEPGWDKVPVPHLPEGAKLVQAEGCGEVQTPVVLAPGTKVEIGGPVLFRHAKAGELAERFTEYLLVSGGKVVERAPTYRGLEACFF
jgi:D-serine deaminase-like pyridoxal phosphate-dependent protein